MTNTPPSVEDRARALVMLMHALDKIMSGPQPDMILREEISTLAAAVVDTATPTFESDRQARYTVGWWHYFRCLALPDDHKKEDLDRAVELLTPFVSADQPTFPPEILTARAVELFHVHHRTGELAPLDEAIILFRAAVTGISAEQADFGTFLSNLGAALSARSEYTHDLATLEEAVDVLRRAVAATPTDHPNIGLLRTGATGSPEKPRKTARCDRPRTKGIGGARQRQRLDL